MATIGIDLGTSNSAAAVMHGGRPVITPSAEGISLGGKAFPSYVAMTADGQMLIGEPAHRQAAANLEGTATAFKRKMGQRVAVALRGRDFSPEQHPARRSVPPLTGAHPSPADPEAAGAVHRVASVGGDIRDRVSGI